MITLTSHQLAHQLLSLPDGPLSLYDPDTERTLTIERVEQISLLNEAEPHAPAVDGVELWANNGYLEPRRRG